MVIIATIRNVLLRISLLGGAIPVVRILMLIWTASLWLAS
jgi:hypothetical protein